MTTVPVHAIALNVARAHDDDGLGAEAVAHAVLRLVADHPGRAGRLRAARIVGGYSVPIREDDDYQIDFGRYTVSVSWNLRDLSALVDALIQGRLLATTPGPRPVLVLTRAGWHALDALEGIGR